MASVIQFPHATPPIQPVALFLRLGESGYQKLGNLEAAGRLPVTRVVADASRVKHQRELLGAFRSKRAEIVLDTRAAELSSVEKHAGLAHFAPWAAIGQGRPLSPDHFNPTHRADVYGQIARFAIEHDIQAVLSPTHYIGDPLFCHWFDVDRKGCSALRSALDREGGRHIAIDYPLILPHVMLNEETARSEFLNGLADLPFDNLWIRASGFGNDAAPLAVRRFIGAMAALHNMGKPIVADYLGGLIGEATLAFGAISGVAHGVGERERFDARSWHKPPKKNPEGKGGRAVRILIPGLDRSATIPELELMASARGGRRLVCCNNRACCPHGLQDMKNDPRQHAAYQGISAIHDLAAIPDLNREAHFLNGRMVDADRQARSIKDLKFSAEEAEALQVDTNKLTKRLIEHSKRVEKMRLTLEDLHETRGELAPRARAVQARLPGSNSTAKTEKK